VDTGLVRFGYQHFIVLGPGSQSVAEASECAAEQDAFWPYHDFMYDPQARQNRGFEKDNLKEFAAELGLDTTAFNTCLDSGAYSSFVDADTALSLSLGVRGTPAFIINGQLVAGAQPFEVFQQIIEAQIGAGEE
jgi:protein-disulfide isomerase